MGHPVLFHVSEQIIREDRSIVVDVLQFDLYIRVPDESSSVVVDCLGDELPRWDTVWRVTIQLLKGAIYGL